MKNKGSFAAAGDLFITRKLPDKGYEGLEELTAFIRSHDIRFVNLEMTVHDREGYPFAFSGGTWAMGHPSLLKDIQKYGFNVYNGANNHSMDYSHNGLMATIRYLKAADMNFAGIGENLADASAPIYIEGEHIRVGMVAAVSSCHPAWAAGTQRPDMKGRPGVNPLRYQEKFHVTKENYELLQKLADEIEINAQEKQNIKEGFATAASGSFHFGTYEFVQDLDNHRESIPDEQDLQRIIRSIQEARKQSDYVMVSIHSHEMNASDKEQPAQFLKTFAHACIDAGADVIIGHGPHILRGIEIYKGKPVFYSLGNFLFENDTTSYQPAEFYEYYKMPADSMVGDGMDFRSRGGTIGLSVNPDVWRSVIASWDVEDRHAKEIRLYPIHMGMELPRYRKGLPAFSADDELLKHLARLSAPFATNVEIQDHVGIIRVESGPLPSSTS